jgi:hemoglobin-like flavoprotein
LDKPEIEVFNDSLARALRGDQLFQRFYELFLESSPEVREKFRNADMRKVRRELKTAFYMLVEYMAMGWPECQAYLERVATVHSRQGRDIAPHLYDLWLECLLSAVKEHDGQWSTEVEAAWRYMMGAGISFLKARYDGPVAPPQKQRAGTGEP